MGDMEPIISMITTGLKVQQEGQVMRAVQEAGVYVDKERLIKALEDARTYWEEGYRAALADRPHGRWEFFDFASPTVECSICGALAGWNVAEEYHSDRTNFCPNCGAKMDLEEDNGQE